MYVLKEWKHQFTGSLTDYLAYILVTLDKPITLDELAEFAKEQFPNTNKKSVYSLISVDPLNRFVIFENGYIGIAGGHHLEDCGLKERRIVRRYDFDSRFESFKFFVISHKRLPIQSKNYSEEEQSLSRWMTNALSGNINISQAQSNSLHVFYRNTRMYLRTGLNIALSKCVIA